MLKWAEKVADIVDGVADGSPQSLQKMIGIFQEKIEELFHINGRSQNIFKLTVDDLYGSSRSQAVATARQIAMYLCRELTSLTLAKIGALFNRHHSTVVHAEKKIAAQLSARREVHDHVREITARVRRECDS